MVISYFKSGFQKLKNALGKTRSVLGSKLRVLFGRGSLDPEKLEELEQLLYEADLGVQTAMDLTEKVQKLYRKNPEIESDEIIEALTKEVVQILTQVPQPEEKPIEGCRIVLIVGVNGNGKTTSLAKLAHLYQKEGKKVLLAASDTFRAAATEQIEKWAEKLNIEVVKGTTHSDPAAVAFDAASAGKARNADIVLIDTAGRLHTKTDLMQELEKIVRVCGKVFPEAPHETLLVLDATTGQNGIEQAKTFHKYCPLSGLILTKLDGTAKGGVAVSIQRELQLPIRYIGTGEQVEDLAPFDAELFANALFH